MRCAPLRAQPFVWNGAPHPNGITTWCPCAGCAAVRARFIPGTLEWRRLQGGVLCTAASLMVCGGTVPGRRAGRGGAGRGGRGWGGAGRGGGDGSSPMETFTFSTRDAYRGYQAILAAKSGAVTQPAPSPPSALMPALHHPRRQVRRGVATRPPPPPSPPLRAGAAVLRRQARANGVPSGPSPAAGPARARLIFERGRGGGGGAGQGTGGVLQAGVVNRIPAGVFRAT